MVSTASAAGMQVKSNVKILWFHPGPVLYVGPCWQSHYLVGLLVLYCKKLLERLKCNLYWEDGEWTKEEPTKFWWDPDKGGGSKNLNMRKLLGFGRGKHAAVCHSS